MPRIPGGDPTAVTAFDALPRCSFAGIEFPILSSDIKGGIRNHVHEYPHSSGGAPEKLGRSLYRITLHAIFDTNFAQYPKLWPERRDQLLQKFERQETADLVVPTLNRGPIPAYCANWTVSMTAKVRSGEKAQLEMVEDSDKDISKYALVQTSASFPSSFISKTGALTAAQLKAMGVDSKGVDIFSAIQQTMSWLKGIQNSATLAVDTLRAKYEALAGQCSSLMGTYGLDLHSNVDFAELIKSTWAYAQAQQATLATQAEAAVYVVPRRMPMTDVAVAVYGNPSRADEIMRWNSAFVQNAFAIEPGTKLVYYV